MIVFVLIIILYPLLVGAILIPLNQKGMLPGTYRYRQIQELETARQAPIIARYRMKENELLDKQMLALEAPKVNVGI